ncbi:MAG: hypothetical protein SLRJCFUN_002393 [Candidatus Fervidibacter sp.]
MVKVTVLQSCHILSKDGTKGHDVRKLHLWWEGKAPAEPKHVGKS